MTYRNLRINWSVFWSVLCLLVIAWWIRGYRWHDGGFVKVPPAYHIQFSAAYGRMTLWLENKPLKYWFYHESYRPHYVAPNADNRISWFNVGFWPRMIRIYVAHWVFVVLLGALALLPWAPRRFSMLGMLVATTAIAIAAGAIVYVDRNLPFH